MQDPMARAMALYRMAFGSANTNEAASARRRLDAHLRKHQIRLEDVITRITGRDDAKARTKRGWAQDPWHVVLAAQVALLRGNICGHYADGHLTVSGAHATRTIQEIMRVRRHIDDRIPGTVRTWPWIGYDPFGNYWDPIRGDAARLGDILAHADSALRIAVLTLAFQEVRVLVPQVDRATLMLALDLELNPEEAPSTKGTDGPDREKVLAGAACSGPECSVRSSTPPRVYPSAAEYMGPAGPAQFFREAPRRHALDQESIQEARAEAAYLLDRGPFDLQKRIVEEANRLALSDVLDRVPPERRLGLGY